MLFFLLGCGFAWGVPNAFRFWFRDPGFLDVGWIAPAALIISAMACWLAAFSSLVVNFSEWPPRKPQPPSITATDANPFKRG